MLFVFVVTYLLTPIIINKSNKLNMLDKPNDRKQHQKAIPRLGGISMFIGFFIPTFIFLKFIYPISLSKDINSLLIITLLGATSFFIIGLFDDLFKYYSPWGRLFFQSLVTIFAWLLGLKIQVINLSFLGFSYDSYALPSFLSLILTLIWFVGITNSINWIDGLDGLAAGFVGIASVGIGLISCLSGNYENCLLSLGIASCCLGFLPFNNNPAKIMMGDSGSYFLGFTLASSSILATSADLTNINLLIPIIILAVPIFDMAYVIFLRVMNANSPFFPDRNHIHHRLIDYGFSYKNTINIIYLLSLISILLVLSIFSNYI